MSSATAIVLTVTGDAQAPLFSYQKAGNGHLGACFTSVIERTGSRATIYLVAQTKGFKLFYRDIVIINHIGLK